MQVPYSRALEARVTTIGSVLYDIHACITGYMPNIILKKKIGTRIPAYGMFELNLHDKRNGGACICTVR